MSQFHVQHQHYPLQLRGPHTQVSTPLIMKTKLLYILRFLVVLHALRKCTTLITAEKLESD